MVKIFQSYDHINVLPPFFVVHSYVAYYEEIAQVYLLWWRLLTGTCSVMLKTSSNLTDVVAARKPVVRCWRCWWWWFVTTPLCDVCSEVCSSRLWDEPAASAAVTAVSGPAVAVAEWSIDELWCCADVSVTAAALWRWTSTTTWRKSGTEPRLTSADFDRAVISTTLRLFTHT